MRGDRLPSWFPWALCWASVALLVTGAGLQIAHPEAFEHGVLYVLAGAAGFVLVPLVGALIAARLPANPYGWLWCGLGALYAVVTLTDGLRRTGAIPPRIAWVVLRPAFVVILCLLVFILLLFPTGRLPGTSWRWLARAAVAVAVIDLLITPFAPPIDDDAVSSPWAVGGPVGDVLAAFLEGGIRVLFLFILLAAVSVLVRFRRGGPVERQQLKWFLLAAGLAAVSLVVAQVGAPVNPRLWALVDAASFAFLPASVGIAVLRYRLYEIDRIISRTVSYGLLTAALVGVYVIVIVLTGPLLETLTGGSSLAVAASTLAVAAAFNPVRLRLQAAVDRRFNRARYDAARAVDAFTRRLRDQVDLDEVTAGLRETVGATVAPTRVAVWLRDPAGRTGSEP